MKKALVLLLALAIILSLAACSSEKSTDKENSHAETQGAASQAVSSVSETTQTAVQNDTPASSSAAADASGTDKASLITQAAEYIESTIGADTAKFKKMEMDPSSSVPYISYSWDYEKEERPDQDLPLDVSFDGLSIKEGTNVSVLTDSGYVLGDAEEEIEAGYSKTPFNCEVSGGRRLYLGLSNTSDTTKPAKECVITDINFMGKIDGVTYQGLTKDASLSDLINQFGLPASGFYVNYPSDSDAPIIQVSYGYGTPNATFRLKYNSSTQTSYLYDIEIDRA